MCRCKVCVFFILSLCVVWINLFIMLGSRFEMIEMYLWLFMVTKGIVVKLFFESRCSVLLLVLSEDVSRCW